MTSSIDEFIEYITFEKNYSSHTSIAYKKDLFSFEKFCLDNFHKKKS